MKTDYVWMLVTSDKYELPLAVRDTAKELGEVAGVKTHTVVSAFSRYNKGELKNCRYRKVIFDE